MWIAHKLKSYVFITRSIGLNGMIPHFGHCIEKNGFLFVEDYIPKVRKDNITDKGDSFLVFDGNYRVRVFELKSIVVSDSLYAARANTFKALK